MQSKLIMHCIQRVSQHPLFSLKLSADSFSPFLQVGVSLYLLYFPFGLMAVLYAGALTQFFCPVLFNFCSFTILRYLVMLTCPIWLLVAAWSAWLPVLFCQQITKLIEDPTDTLMALHEHRLLRLEKLRMSLSKQLGILHLKEPVTSTKRLRAELRAFQKTSVALQELTDSLLGDVEYLSFVSVLMPPGKHDRMTKIAHICTSSYRSLMTANEKFGQLCRWLCEEQLSPQQETSLETAIESRCKLENSLAKARQQQLLALGLSNEQ